MDLLEHAFGGDASQLAAEQRQALLSRLLSRLAHEVRNPLSSLDIHVQLLEEDISRLPANSVPNVAGRLAIIRTEIHRLDNIVRQFLSLAGPSSMELRPTALGEVIEHVRQLLGSEAAAREIALDASVAPNLPSIQADAAQLTQVLVNLVINALQAVSRAGRVEIAARADDARPGVVVTVRDSGPGIAPEIRTAMFEPFFTTKTEGSGLGLWIVQQIARAHGGTIDGANAPEGGALFTLRLPLQRATAPS